VTSLDFRVFGFMGAGVCRPAGSGRPAIPSAENHGRIPHHMVIIDKQHQEPKTYFARAVLEDGEKAQETQAFKDPPSGRGSR
jgi:hypothetical protein